MTITDAVFLSCLFEVLIIRSDKMVSHMVEESHVRVKEVVDLSHNHGKVILYVVKNLCTL